MWDFQIKSSKRHTPLVQILPKNHLTFINKPDTYTDNHPTGQGSCILDLAFATLNSIDLMTNKAGAEDIASESDHEVFQFAQSSNTIASAPPQSNEQFNQTKADLSTFHNDVNIKSNNTKEEGQNLHPHSAADNLALAAKLLRNMNTKPAVIAIPL